MLEDIQKLANILNDAHTSMVKTLSEDQSYNQEYLSLDVRVEYKVFLDDGSEFTSQNTSLFNEESNIFNSHVNKIEMSLNNHSDDKSIIIKIEQSEYIFHNSIHITGLDSMWLSALKNKCQNVLNAIKDQNMFFFKGGLFAKIVTYFFLLFMIYYANSVFLSFLSLQQNPILNQHAIDEWLKFILTMSVTLCLIFTEQLFSLWPQVELKIGPEHKDPNVTKRKIVLWVFSIIWSSLILPKVLVAIWG